MGRVGRKPGGREGRGAGHPVGRPHSPLPQDAVDGGLHVVHTARGGCLLLVSEKVRS